MTNLSLLNAVPVLTVTERDIDVQAQVGAWTVALPAGRWLLRSRITSTPAIGAQPTVTNELDTTLAAAGNATLAASTIYHAHKDFEHNQGGQIIAEVSVARWDGSRWRGYAGNKATVAFAAAPAPRTNQLWGGNVHLFGSYRSVGLQAWWDHCLDAAVDLGLSFVRTSVPWSNIETAAGVQDAGQVAIVDAFFASVAARGLKVLAVLGSTPGWARVGAPTVPDVFGPYSSTAVSNGYGPTNWQDYKNYATWFVNRYTSQGLFAVESHNEPADDAAYSMNPNVDTTWTAPASDVVARLHNLYDAVKAAQPTVKVIGFAIAYCDTTLLGALYDAGLDPNKYDAISCHPYPVTFDGKGARNPRYPIEDAFWRHGPSALSAMSELMTARGDPSKPLWVTEYGVSSGIGNVLNVTEATQSDHLTYLARQLARVQRLEALSFHSLEDKGRNYIQESPADWGGFGVVRTDHISRKPVYAAMKTQIAAIKAGTG